MTTFKRRTVRRPIFRKQLVLPAEHGSWAWLLVPFFVGTAVAGQWNFAVTLVLIGGLAAFLVRQPATVWLRASQGRARRSDGPLAAGWTLGLALVALSCLAGLLLMGRTALIWLLPPLLLILVLYLMAVRQNRASTRALWMEVAGAVALAALAPAAIIAATGHITTTAWALWGLMALQNGLGAVYVRLRIADTHGRPVKRWPVFWGHAAGAAAVLLASALTVVPWLAALPFLAFLLRAGWAVVKPRPIPRIKRFGFIEVGVEVASGLVIITAYSMA
ncbi:MAG TPA: YwiC-like family protein [Anaerolineae bacterium]